MKAKTKKHVILTLALAIIMTCAMSITAFASDAPTGLRQTESTTEGFTVEWNAVSGADGYFVYKSKDNVNWVRIWNDWNNTEDGDYPEFTKGSDTSCRTSLYLEPGTTYYVKVVPAYSVAPFSYSKGTASASLAVVTTPNRINKVTQTKASSKGVTLKWSSVPGVTAYNIYCSDDNDKKVASTKNTSVTIKQTAGTSKKYLVCPVRTSGTFSAEVSKTTANLYGGAVQAKAVPRQPVYVANSKKKNLSWDLKTNKVTLSADIHKKDATCEGFQYAIYSANGKKKLKTTVKDRWTDVTFKLKAVKNAGFQVMARGYTTVNGKKYYGAWSAKQVVIPQPVVKAPDDITTSTATIKWSKISGATKYYVYAAQNCPTCIGRPKFKKVATVNGKKTSYKLSGIRAGKWYAVYVVPVVKVKGKSYTGMKEEFWWGYRYSH